LPRCLKDARMGFNTFPPSSRWEFLITSTELALRPEDPGSRGALRTGLGCCPPCPVPAANRAERDVQAGHGAGAHVLYETVRPERGGGGTGHGCRGVACAGGCRSVLERCRRPLAKDPVRRAGRNARRNGRTPRLRGHHHGRARPRRPAQRAAEVGIAGGQARITGSRHHRQTPCGYSGGLRTSGQTPSTRVRHWPVRLPSGCKSHRLRTQTPPALAACASAMPDSGRTGHQRCT
jgi:hypothetical protein